MTEVRPGLADRVRIAQAKAATPGYEGYLASEQVDVQAFHHVGDPLAEALLVDLRDRGLVGRDLIADGRRLQAQGVPSAVDFFADVEHVPAWADFDAMRAGARMGRRNPIGMIFGFHGALSATYLDPATPRVMISTGRLARQGEDFRRRFWETATGFVGALDVDGMKPGGPRWEQWVRIRLLHTIIRTGIIRTGDWDLTESMPISQTATAAATHLFGPFRVDIIRSFGGTASLEEADSFSLMWRWISRLQGASTELLGRTPAEQLRLAERMYRYLFAPNHESRDATRQMLDGLAGMREFHLNRWMHAAVLRRDFAGHRHSPLPKRDLAADLGVDADPRAELLLAAAAGGIRVVNRILGVGPVRRRLDRRAQEFLDAVVDRGLDRRRAEFRAANIDAPGGLRRAGPGAHDGR